MVMHRKESNKSATYVRPGPPFRVRVQTEEHGTVRPVNTNAAVGVIASLFSPGLSGENRKVSYSTIRIPDVTSDATPQSLFDETTKTTSRTTQLRARSNPKLTARAFYVEDRSCPALRNDAK